MPRKNTENREQVLPYHVYNRARKGRRMFVDDADRDHFLDLIACRLSRSTARASRRHRFSNRIEGVELFAYCLMTTHFHLVIWQREPEALRRFMQSLISAYVRYYNKRHGTTGPMFAERFRSRPLTNPKDLRWAIAYVHDNHPSGLDYRYSTHRAYVDSDLCPGWLNTRTPLKHFEGISGYRVYLSKRTERATLNDLLF